MDFSKVIFEIPQIRTARLENGKWVVLDSLANEIVTETKIRHYERLCEQLNKARRA